MRLSKINNVYFVAALASYISWQQVENIHGDAYVYGYYCAAGGSGNLPLEFNDTYLLWCN